MTHGSAVGLILACGSVNNFFLFFALVATLISGVTQQKPADLNLHCSQKRVKNSEKCMYTVHIFHQIQFNYFKYIKT